MVIFITIFGELMLLNLLEKFCWPIRLEVLKTIWRILSFLIFLFALARKTYHETVVLIFFCFQRSYSRRFGTPLYTFDRWPYQNYPIWKHMMNFWWQLDRTRTWLTTPKKIYEETGSTKSTVSLHHWVHSPVLSHTLDHTKDRNAGRIEPTPHKGTHDHSRA